MKYFSPNCFILESSCDRTWTGITLSFHKTSKPRDTKTFTLLGILLKIRWASTLNTENSQLFGKTDEIQKLFTVYPRATRGGGSLPSAGRRAEERLARCRPAPPEAPLTRGACARALAWRERLARPLPEHSAAAALRRARGPPPPAHSSVQEEVNVCPLLLSQAQTNVQIRAYAGRV